MNILITLDYELFFGSKIGSVEKCIIAPTEALLEIVDPLGIKLCVFVDVGFLVRLKEYYSDYPELKKEYQQIVSQLKLMSKNGHDLQLHVHPHWEDCVYDGKWKMDTSRYRLNHFSDDEIHSILFRYKRELELISGSDVFAFRAGGWSIQPFQRLAEAFKELGITIDSTVFKGGVYQSDHQKFDFSKSPKFSSVWNFEEDPAIEEKEGTFLEVPIASRKYSPFFYWRFVWKKLWKSQEDLAFGDGKAVKNSNSHIFKLLFQKTLGVVSIDGFKASVLQKAFKEYQKRNHNDFVLIGHPKAFTPYSLEKVKEFVDQNKSENFCTYRDYRV